MSAYETAESTKQFSSNYTATVNIFMCHVIAPCYKTIQKYLGIGKIN